MQGLSIRNQELLDSIAKAVLEIPGQWIIGGDFNLTPEDLRDAGFLDKLDAQVILPPDATGRIIDFFVVIVE